MGFTRTWRHSRACCSHPLGSVSCGGGYALQPCSVSTDYLGMRVRRCAAKTLWPSGLRRWLKAPFRKGVGSNPTGVTFAFWQLARRCFQNRPSHTSKPSMQASP